MAGNRALYDRAMEQSREATRQKHWDEALKQAVRALQEFPQDLDARSSAAAALFSTGKYPQALQMFEELRAADATNPFYLEYVARVNEQMGNTTPAVTAYTQLADLQLSRRLGAKAIEALREVLRLRPSADDQRLRLAQLYAEAGNTNDAAAEFLTLSRSSQERGQLELAERHADDARRLSPNSREIKEHMAALGAALESAATASISSPANDPIAAAMPGMTGSLRGQQFAVDKLVAMAQELQEKGDAAGAIEQYERAIKHGADRPDVFYSLGLLYQERGDHQPASEMLQRAAADSEYALSAHYSLGTSYEALGQLPQAAQEYEQTIRLVDLQSIGKAESEDLIVMYESAANIYSQLNDIARAASLYSTLANFLASKRWGRDRAEDFRRKAKELTDRNMFAKLRTLGTGALTAPEPSAAPLMPRSEPMPETWGKIRPITDFLRPQQAAASSSVDIFATPAAPSALAAPSSPIDTLPIPIKPDFKPLARLDISGLDESIAAYVTASETYLEQGLRLAAIDACMEVIRLEPNFLPIHMRMGEIYERNGHPEEALTKYQLLIETYLARNEPRRAIDVYYRLIELSPDTINARARLADLLKNDNRIDAAAEQLGQVASAYFRMGQTNKALEEYRRGLQWAPNSAPLHAQYGQSLLKLERYEAALGEFRRALEIDQTNVAAIASVNAALALMGDQPAAVWQSLATLLERLKALPHGVTLAEVQAEYRSALLVQDAAIIHYILGIIQQASGQHQSALLEFEQASDLLRTDEDPMLPPVLVFQAMADSSIALGHADEALSQLQRGQAVAAGVAHNPEFARYPFASPLSTGDIVRRMAEAFAASGDMAGAEQSLQQAKQLLPYDRTIYTKLADIYFRQGKLTEALAQLEELATHYERQQDLDRAIESLEYALKLAPNNIAIGQHWAQINLRRGYLDKGVEGLNKVAEQQRKAGQIKDAVASLQQVADVHWTLGQQEQARAVYDKIVKIAPNDLEARQWLAFMYTLAGRTDDAVGEKKQLVRLFLQQRDFDGAIAELHQIIGINQHDADAYFQLGDVLMRREEYDQAIRIYGRLAKMPDVEVARVEALQTAAKRMLEQQQLRAKG